MTNVWAVFTALGILLLALASLGTLMLLYAQVRVTRRAAAGQLLDSLQKEYQSLRGAWEAVAAPGPLEPAAPEIERALDFFARLEQLVAVGALEAPVAERVFGEGVRAIVGEERVRREILGPREGRYADAIALHERLG